MIRNNKSPIRIVLLLFWISFVCLAVTLPTEETKKETDPQVIKHLEWFQDVKFGLMMHWGPYSQWGVVESWSICPEDCDGIGTYIFAVSNAFWKCDITSDPY